MYEISNKEMERRATTAEASMLLTRAIGDINKKLKGLTPGEWIWVLGQSGDRMIREQLKEDWREMAEGDDGKQGDDV